MKKKKCIIVVILVVGIASMLTFSSAHADTASVQAQLQSLLQQLSQLQNQVNGTTLPPAATPTLSAPPRSLFARNLTIGSQGTDVFALQQALITDGYLTAVSVPTGYFGPVTKNALMAYQNANGISPASGYFGLLTRARFNTIDGTTTALTVTNGAQGLAAVQYQYDQLHNSTSSSQASQPTASVSPQPTASLKANGSTGAIMIPYGSSVILTWSSSNANSCNISPAGFTGTSGDQTIANLTASQIYSLTCTKGAESAVVSVSVFVAAPSQTSASVTPSNNNQTTVSSETVSQTNAVKKAESYLGYTAFSHDGLVAQLEYGKFSHADAVYGADNSGANWNEQALKKAKSYLDYSAFSRDGLVDQLEYSKFSNAEAVYGADNAGANWHEQAAKKAKSYMEYSAFSRGGLIDQLKYSKFTQEQAEYGANAVGL